MIPTRRLWILIGLGVVVGAVSYQWGLPWVLGAYNVLLLLAALATGMLAPSVANLKLKRKFDPVLSVRVPNRIHVELHNDGPEPIRARIRDEAPQGFEVEHNEFDIKLDPNRYAETSFSVTPFERGSTFFRGTFARLECPLGLVKRQVRLVTEQPVRVYPNVLAFKEFDLLKQKGKLNQMGIRKSRTRGLGMEFESLREYAQGDDYRKIDWKASARKGGLVVREFEREKNQSVILCIDTGRLMLSEVNGVPKLDHVLDSCLMLAHAVVSSGDLIGLLLYSDGVRRFIPPKKGRAQMGAIIEAIHDVVAEPVETDVAAAFAFLGARWKRRSLLINFTDVEDEEAAQALLGSFGPLARRHVSLVARVGDPMLKGVSTGAIHSADDLYLKAAALTFVDDRRRAGIFLSAADIHHLEAEPQDLAAALVSFYFMVKERSLL